VVLLLVLVAAASWCSFSSRRRRGAPAVVRGWGGERVRVRGVEQGRRKGGGRAHLDVLAAADGGGRLSMATRGSGGGGQEDERNCCAWRERGKEGRGFDPRQRDYTRRI
jgi:hypothetical protein